MKNAKDNSKTEINRNDNEIKDRANTKENLVKNESDEVKAAKINSIALISAAVIAAIASLFSIYLGWSLDSSKENVQELQNQLNQSNQKIEELEKQLYSGGKNDDNPEINVTYSKLSAEELIEQNLDLIKQLKEEYSNTETLLIKSDRVKFGIYEKAGYIYQDMKKMGNYIILHGEPVYFSKIIILDYYNDEIIYDFSPKENENVTFSPGNVNKFYCVIFHDDYEIYVTPSIEVIGGDYSEWIEINLDKKDFQYTPLFQFRLNVQDFQIDELSSIIPEDYWIHFKYTNMYTNGDGGSYSIKMSDARILSWGSCTYFSLNTNYAMDISLYRDSDNNSISTHQTFDGSATNSNLIDIYLEFSDESDTSE